MPSERDKPSEKPYEAQRSTVHRRSSAPYTAALIAGGLTGGFVVRYVAVSQDWLIGGEPKSLSILGQCFFCSLGGVMGGVAASVSAGFLGRYISPLWLKVMAVPLGVVVGGLSSLGGCFVLAVMGFGGTTPPGFFRPLDRERSLLETSAPPITD